LFSVFLGRLFSDDVFNKTFNLLLVDIDTQVNSMDTWMFSVGMSLWLLMLRWFTVSIILYAILAPYFKLRRVNVTVAFLGISISLLNIIFFKQNLIAFTGVVQYVSYRSIQFALETTIVLVISIIELYTWVNTHKTINTKEILKTLGIFIIVMFSVFPQGFLYATIGYYGDIPEDFNMLHIVMILIPVVFLIVAYQLMKNKTQEQKNFFIVLIAFAAFFQFFYVRRGGLAGLPLHLCNTAIIIMLFSAVFKIRKFFYFNYFANVLGALIALLIPSMGGDVNTLSSMGFLFNHWYVFTWPILAVALHTFERPILSYMHKALLVFTIYYIAMVFLNAWFNNYQFTDYFFTYSDHITELLGARDLQYGNVISFEYHGLTFIFYWLYQVLLFFGFIFLMFMSWYVYDASYRFSDQHHALKLKQQQMKMDELRLKELLNGRKITEPINPQGVNMIKISHFSKKYGNSNTYAVKDFSLEVHKGEVFGFLGHNGAGKSTTIKSLVGIQSITEGEMEICGYSIKSQPLEAKLQIGYVSDNHAVYEKLTGHEYISYVADLYKVDPKVREERLVELLDKFVLAYAIDREIKSYSHGMKQKLVVIAALIHEPPVWILDEPLTGLDPTSAFQIKESMREHAEKGNIVFFSSHVIEVVEKICDRIAIITNGELQGVYNVKEVLASGQSLESLYMSKINKVEKKND